MTRDVLLKTLAAAIDEAMAGRRYGAIQIEFRAGKPTFIRQTKEDKLDNETETRTNGNHQYNR